MMTPLIDNPEGSERGKPGGNDAKGVHERLERHENGGGEPPLTGSLAVPPFRKKRAKGARTGSCARLANRLQLLDLKNPVAIKNVHVQRRFWQFPTITERGQKVLKSKAPRTSSKGMDIQFMAIGKKCHFMQHLIWEQIIAVC